MAETAQSRHTTKETYLFYHDGFESKVGNYELHPDSKFKGRDDKDPDGPQRDISYLSSSKNP